MHHAGIVHPAGPALCYQLPQIRQLNIGPYLSIKSVTNTIPKELRLPPQDDLLFASCRCDM
jgi:hypothetical protein